MSQEEILNIKLRRLQATFKSGLREIEEILKEQSPEKPETKKKREDKGAKYRGLLAKSLLRKS